MPCLPPPGSWSDPSQDPGASSASSTQPPTAFGQGWSLLPDHCGAEGCWTPKAQRKKGQKSLCSGGRSGESCKNPHPKSSPLSKSSREVSPRGGEGNSWRIPQEEAASLTRGGFPHLFPGSFTSTFAGKSESLPSSKVRAKPHLRFSSPGLETERGKRSGTHRGRAGKSPGDVFQRWKTGGHPWISEPWSKHFPWLGFF